MREDIEKILNGLVTGNNSEGHLIITGYNYYPTCLPQDYESIIIFSNIHRCDRYRDAVIQDINALRLNSNDYKVIVREKFGFFQWHIDFILREESGVIGKDLKIHDHLLGTDINLEHITSDTLEKAGYSESEKSLFIAQNKEFEIDILLKDMNLLYPLTDLFLYKSSIIVPNCYNTEDSIITTTEKKWRSAWKIPLLIIQKYTQQKELNIHGFQSANIIRFEEQDIGEYSFIINNKLADLQKASEYKKLCQLGFQEERGLANITFIKGYVDIISV